MKKYAWIILLISILLPACGRDTTPVLAPTPIPPVVSADSILVAQCRFLEDAVEAFTASNDGEYPLNLDTDTLETGESVLDLMAGGGVYVNPYTDEETLPANGQAGEPGAIAYEPVIVEETVFGYTITGFGEESIEVELSNLASPEDAQVIANCMVAVEEVEAHAEEILGRITTEPYQNIFPLDERNGKRISLVTCWPLYRNVFMNPFTSDDQLILRTAEEPGETGYVSIIRNNHTDGYVVTGYGYDSVIFAESSFDCTMEEAVVISNCRTLEKALEQFAWDNAGLYPSNLLIERNYSGKTVLDYLHDGRGLINPYNGLRHETTTGTSGLPGQISYEVEEYFGLRMGYRIRGFGEDGQVIEMTNIESTEEASVRYNCYTLMDAVEAFAASSGGRYPSDILNDENLSGETVIDLMPRGRAPLNPYTGQDDGLANHIGVIAGQTGYAKIEGRYRTYDPETRVETSQDVDGYVITGHSEYGWEFAISNFEVSPIDALVLSNCRTVQLAANKFAMLNDNVYPGNVSCSYTPGGESVVDLLPGGILLINPTTNARTEPIDAAAATSGQAGYSPVILGGINVGYCITGAGELCGVQTYTVWVGPPDDDNHIER